MNLLGLFIRQPVTVAVGVILTILAGIIALSRIPIQLTPNVEDTIVTVSTFWEGASPQEIEQEIIAASEGDAHRGSPGSSQGHRSFEQSPDAGGVGHRD